MTSKVLFKFKTGRDQTEIRFNGPSIRTSDLVSRIITMRGMTRSQTDFDLVVENSQTKVIYKHDDLIPKNSRLVVNRVSSSFGYLARAHGSAKPHEPNKSSNSNNPHASTGNLDITGLDEFGGNIFDDDASEHSSSAVSKLAAVAQQKNRHQRHQARMQQQQRLPPGVSSNRNDVNAQRSAASNYSSGPLSQQKLEELARRRVIGVPRNLLKAEEDTPNSNDTQKGGLSGNHNAGSSISASSDPFASGWMKFKASTDKFIQEVSRKGGVTTQLNEIEVRERLNHNDVPSNILCPLTKKLLKEAVTTPCCRKAASRDALEENLIKNDFVCPFCTVRGLQPSRLVPNASLRSKTSEYISEIKVVLEKNAILDAERAAVAAQKDREDELLKQKSYSRPDQILDLSEKYENVPKNAKEQTPSDSMAADSKLNGLGESDGKPKVFVEDNAKADKAAPQKFQAPVSESSWAGISQLVSETHGNGSYDDRQRNNDKESTVSGHRQEHSRRNEQLQPSKNETIDHYPNKDDRYVNQGRVERQRRNGPRRRERRRGPSNYPDSQGGQRGYSRSRSDSDHYYSRNGAIDCQYANEHEAYHPRRPPQSYYDEPVVDSGRLFENRARMKRPRDADYDRDYSDYRRGEPRYRSRSRSRASQRRNREIEPVIPPVVTENEVAGAHDSRTEVKLSSGVTVGRMHQS